MAVTNIKSDILTLQNALTGARLPRYQFGSELLYAEAIATQGAAAGDANSTLDLVRVPAGSNLLLHASKLVWTAFGASRVLSIGYRAYRKADGTTQAESLTALGTALDVSSAGTAFMNTLTNPIHTFYFEGDAEIVLQCTGGTIPTTEVLRAYLWLSRG
jgi:hypothetical protein